MAVERVLDSYLFLMRLGDASVTAAFGFVAFSVAPPLVFFSARFVAFGVFSEALVLCSFRVKAGSGSLGEIGVGIGSC